MNKESSVSACQLTGKYWVVTSRPCPGLCQSQEVWGQRNPPYQRPSGTDLHGNKSVVLSEASPAIPKTSSRHSHHALPASAGTHFHLLWGAVKCPVCGHLRASPVHLQWWGLPNTRPGDVGAWVPQGAGTALSDHAAFSLPSPVPVVCLGNRPIGAEKVVSA